MTRKAEPIQHTLAPCYDEHSRILVLGTMPSPKSRETGFYYGHPQNRFWRVLSLVLSQPMPESNIEKRQFLLKNHIALWDVIKHCEMTGADDASIRHAAANDIPSLLKKTAIQAIFTTGTKAASLYQKLCYPQTKIPAILLPSPSPANCRWHTLESLTEAYQAICPYLEDRKTLPTNSISPNC